MSFVTKTPAEFEAMSEYQKEKYLDQKAKHEQSVIKELAEKSAKEAFELHKEEFAKSNTEALTKMQEANEAKLKEFAEKHSLQMDDMQKALNRAKVGEVNERMKGMSEEIIEKLSTEEGENMIKSFFKGQREALKLEVDAQFITKAPMTVPTNGVAPHFTPVVGPGHDDFHARDVIPVFPTMADIIRYVQFTVDPAAAGIGITPEAGQKPSMGYLSAVKSAPVVKIAGLLDVSDEMLDDVVGFRSWLAFELPKAYLDFEDQQIFKGDGTNDNLLGLWYQANPQTFPLGGVTASSNTIDQIMAGITEVRTLKRATTAVFISPVDWMKIFINKGNTEEYTYPFILDANGILRIGGIAIYWSNVFNEGEGLVGDFARGTAIFQRNAMNIRYGDQHVDNFGKNIVTIRIEGRIALPIFYPEAFLRLFPQTS